MTTPTQQLHLMEDLADDVGAFEQGLPGDVQGGAKADAAVAAGQDDEMILEELLS